MVDIDFTRRLDFLDFSEVEVVGHVLTGISDILEYNFLSRLKDWSVKERHEIRVSLLSQGYIDSVKAKYDGYFTKRPYPFDLDKVKTGALSEEVENGVIKYSFLKFLDVSQFRDLAECEVHCDGKPFPFTAYDIHKLKPERVLKVRDILLDAYYDGLKKISKFTGANEHVLDVAYKETKATCWLTEKHIGDVVVSRGKNPRKAQLIARWEPDYIYHIARIFETDGSIRDILFMIYWRKVGRRLLENPGRLSWMDKETLKYIPESSSDYRLAFKTDAGPIDFSYYYNPKGRRAFEFRSHLTASKNSPNLLCLNY